MLKETKKQDEKVTGAGCLFSIIVVKSDLYTLTVMGNTVGEFMEIQ